MIMQRDLILPLFLFFFLPPCLSFTQERIVTELSSDWKFFRGHNDSAYLKDFDDSHGKVVNIPHDWAIEGPWIRDGDGNTGKLPWKGEGWYRKSLDIPAGSSGKRFYLLCDGIMAFPKIFVNGRLAGQWDYGYNSFWVDITDFLDFTDENILAVHADTRRHESRWYPGAGIYRKIRLIAVNPIHISIWGTYITTPVISSRDAEAHIYTTVSNHTPIPGEITVKHTILAPDGQGVAVKEVTETLQARQEQVLETSVHIPNPRLWNVDDPALYSIVTEVYRNGKRLDSTSHLFGIREMRFTRDDGFYLNNKRIHLKGVNLHHDHGPLGAAFNKRAMKRQLQIMKSMGCNAIRTSHNPAAPELLELCDEMGLLVLNEVFDKYDAKADITDTTGFESFTRRNIRNFILRDRNHPSVFLWSVGNEIPDIQWNREGGFDKLKIMIREVRRYDTVRPVTLVCDSEESAALRHFDFYDVHCWNYGRRYSLARQMDPGKSVIISESASTVSTRGFYEFPLPSYKTDFTRSLQVSSYDLNAPPWAELADDDFRWQQEEPYVAGEFVWTGFDYLGEPTPYTNQWAEEQGLADSNASRSSYFGIVDLCGIPKDRYYLYKSYWQPEETTVHILPHWNWEDRAGQHVPVFIYTNADCAELFVNGRSFGKKCKDPRAENPVERFRLIWMEVPYEPGTLMAVACKDGNFIGTGQVKTAGKPVQLKLTPDRAVIVGDGSDVSYILVEALDAEGIPCPLADNRVDIRLTGPGRIAGVCNGNPQSFEPFQANYVDLFYGKAMILVSSAETPGTITLETSSKGLQATALKIHTVTGE